MNRRTARLGGLAVGAVVWLLLGGWFAVLPAAAVAMLVSGLLRRAEPRTRRRERERIAGDLPFAADLLAATLRAGMPIESALRVVGPALGGPLGHRLVRVADGLRLGLAPGDAWAPLHSSPGCDRLADVVVHTADSGAAIAGGMDRLADALRAAGAARVESAAQRLNVLMVLPLGLCFLPAFVFAGIVPVIIAVLSSVLR
jgi:pilus assembly protein TadC